MPFAHQARRRAADAYADRQLVARAAWDVARHPSVLPGAVVDPLYAAVFQVALGALRPTLGRAAYDALAGQYHADRAGFVARLAERGV